MPVAFATGLGVDVGGAVADEVGGEVSEHSATACDSSLPEEPDGDALVGAQAATARSAATPIAVIARGEWRIGTRLTRNPPSGVGMSDMHWVTAAIL
jgi:ABC-type amino acid transport substrate-binding protein